LGIGRSGKEERAKKESWEKYDKSHQAHQAPRRRMQFLRTDSMFHQHRTR
jgi:hypothetical protein